MFFSEVLGQQEIKKILIDSVRQNRISHAQLFLGQEGSGNLALALAYAQYILCKNRSNQDSCGQCSSCIKVKKYIHPDLHFIFPVNTTKEVTKDPSSDLFLETWRSSILNNPYLNYEEWLQNLGIGNKQGFINKKDCEEIIHKLELKPYESPFKIMIIWLPEKMHHAAAPKILKILEEPTDNTFFILVSENTQNMLSTILSRLQTIKLQPNSSHEISAYLSTHETFKNFSEEEINVAARLANGSISEAKNILFHKNDTYQNDFLQWMRWCYVIHKDNNAHKVLSWLESFNSNAQDQQKYFIEYCLNVVRQCIYMNYKVNDLVNLTENEYHAIQKFAPFINGANVLQITEEFEKCYYYISRNANVKILLFDLSFKLAKLIREKEVQTH